MADKIRISRRRNYREQLRLYLNLTKRLNAKLKKLFRKQSIQASSQYAKGILDPDNFADSYGDELYKILANQYKTAITQGAERVVVQRYKKASESIDKIITDYVAINTAQKVTQISETTRKKLNATIKKGLVDGDSIKDISRNIKNSDSFSTRRATLIARTETHSAMNAGSMEITKTLSLNEPVKEWNSAMDERARYYHKSMDGTVIGINESFVVMTPTKYGVVPKRMQYTGDSNGGAANVCNCRCFTSYYDSEDEVIDAVPKKPVIAPDLPIPEELVVVDPITPIKFVGFGRTNKREEQFHKESWSNSPEKYKSMVAKFEEITISQRGKGAFYTGRAVDPYINIPKSKTGYSKQATYVHEYGHYMDNQIRKNLDTGYFKKLSKRAEDLKSSVVNPRERYASLLYAKEIAKDAKKVEENIKNKYYVKKTNEAELNKFAKEIDDKYPNIYNESSEKQKEFIQDMFNDGKIFTKDDLNQIIFFDTKKQKLNPQEIKFLIKFKFANKEGIIDTPRNLGEGTFIRLKYLTDDRTAGKEFAVNTKEDLGSLADYMGAITTEKFGYGHGKSYYTKKHIGSVNVDGITLTDRNSTEAFAQYMSLSASPQSELYRKKMTDFAPNTKKGFDELTDEILTLENKI